MNHRLLRCCIGEERRNPPALAIPILALSDVSENRASIAEYRGVTRTRYR